MKKIVVYQSSTGFTKQYAQWIAKECECQAADIKKIQPSELKQYDCIIYGGWVMGNMIRGLEKITKLSPKKLIVFAVGATPDIKEVKSAIKAENHLESTPFFYMEGGFHFEELKFLTKTMLKTLKKSVAKKENKTEQEIFMEKNLGTTFDHTDKKYIVPLVSYVKGL